MMRSYLIASRVPLLFQAQCRRSISEWLPADLGAYLRGEPKVRQVGDPVLREAASNVDPAVIQTPEFKNLIKSMVQVMRSKKGSGIAAPQIGVGLQVFALEYTGQHFKRLKDHGFSDKEIKRMGVALIPLRVFINPEMKIVDSNMLAFREGCLSVEGFSALVPRAKEVEVTGLDDTGNRVVWRVAGWPARIVQHEMDHLKGNLYIDTMLYKTFMNNEWHRFSK